MKKFLIYFARLVYGRTNSNSFPRVLILLFDIFIVMFSYFLLLLLKSYDHLETLLIANSLKELLPVVIVFGATFLIMLFFTFFLNLRLHLKNFTLRKSLVSPFPYLLRLLDKSVLHAEPQCASQSPIRDLFLP